ncbi:hypothetical protein CTI12_AA335750 [Artemisia annua]|uniref:DUF3511 domain protein n=1 Tax=Artemisia annua TaxID=35608 RepID=A0A2U1MVJ9_ARTAN|nr:hypothetical protein CTI12_AA335750 [Artemisia annua]
MDHMTNNNNPNFKKSSKSTNGSMTKAWSFSDPELQRKKRVASYKAYTVEGKVKGSFKKSFRWIKDKYSQMGVGNTYGDKQGGVVPAREHRRLSLGVYTGGPFAGKITARFEEKKRPLDMNVGRK